MAKTVELKIPDDIEYRVIGNAFGLLIASAGLLAGEMVRLRSFDYWASDIVPLFVVLWMLFRLYRNLLSTMIAYRDVPSPSSIIRDQNIRQALKSEQEALAQITAKTGYTADQVVAEVAKRIESKKNEALKKNKMIN
ncbi:MAG: hypothetical protein PHN84_08815 [Desulfuromonadaceae bacterium]|nr:hypothetical protein [Desulfuromonadaceae bacterium]MDD2854740.1 hypothetical protein [Desulfuromonadaceae bacterium]